MARWKAIPVAGLAALIVGAALVSTQYGRASAAPSPNGSLSLDCDTAVAGIQATCGPIGAGARDIAVVFQNNLSTAVTMSALNFDLVGNNKAVFTPNPAGGDQNLNSNPDFNEAGFPTLGCTLPPPNPNIDPPAASTSRSQLVCIAPGNGPTIAAGASLLLATVHYTVSGTSGIGNFTLENVSLTDNGIFEIGSCNQVIAVQIDCPGATVTLGGGATATPTSTSTAVPTATPSSTPCGGTCPPTATGTTIKGVTVTPTPGTPTVSPPPTIAGGGSPTTAAPGVNPPPPGTGPGGNAGAGGARPIRLPDTGSDGGSANRNSIALIALFALVAGGLAGGAYLGTTKLSSARRRQDED